MTIIRADQVGSLLRSAKLLSARRSHKAGTLDSEALGQAEDEAIAEVVALQKQAGIGVLSDGEFRRSAWGNGVIDSLAGLARGTAAQGGRRWHGEHADVAQETVPQHYVAVKKLRLIHRFAFEEARYLKTVADRPFKITIPSPSMFTRLFNPKASPPAYETVDAVLDDLVELYMTEIDALGDLEVPYMQLDSLRYIDAIDAVENGRADPKSMRGTLERLVAIDNRVLGRMKRAGATRAVHICRGNHRSSWGVSGSYESVAEMLLGEVETDRFLLEFDSERAGGFEPLRFVPKGKIVVLGLVTTKTGEIEDIDHLLRRIDEASTFVPLDYLAVSPQCGFASTELGNLLTVDQQQRKLELVVEIARRVWG